MSPSSQPRVSFGLPVYNEEAAIRRCLDSILAQDFTDFEVVVSDNASTDRTREIVAEYVARDPRVRLFVNDRNVGGNANFNLAFDRARGELFRWIGADDLLEPTYLSASVAALDADPGAIVATTGFAMHYPDGSVRSESYEGERIESEHAWRRLARMVWFFHAGATKYEPLYSLMRREALARTGRIRPIVYDDYVLMSELSLAGRFTHVPAVLFHRRFRTPSDYRELYEQLIPGYRKGLIRSYATLVRTLLALIAAAPLSRRERTLCYAVAFRYFGSEAWKLCKREWVRFRRERLRLTRARLRRWIGAGG
jgi:glycosyltransferase involved in cell wall biosynthesis